MAANVQIPFLRPESTSLLSRAESPWSCQSNAQTSLTVGASAEGFVGSNRLSRVGSQCSFSVMQYSEYEDSGYSLRAKYSRAPLPWARMRVIPSDGASGRQYLLADIFSAGLPSCLGVSNKALVTRKDVVMTVRIGRNSGVARLHDFSLKYRQKYYFEAHPELE